MKTHADHRAQAPSLEPSSLSEGSECFSPLFGPGREHETKLEAHGAPVKRIPAADTASQLPTAYHYQGDLSVDTWPPVPPCGYEMDASPDLLRPINYDQLLLHGWLPGQPGPEAPLDALGSHRPNPRSQQPSELVRHRSGLIVGVKVKLTAANMHGSRLKQRNTDRRSKVFTSVPTAGHAPPSSRPCSSGPASSDSYSVWRPSSGASTRPVSGRLYSRTSDGAASPEPGGGFRPASREQADRVLPCAETSSPPPSGQLPFMQVLAHQPQRLLMDGRGRLVETLVELKAMHDREKKCRGLDIVEFRSKPEAALDPNLDLHRPTAQLQVSFFEVCEEPSSLEVSPSRMNASAWQPGTIPEDPYADAFPAPCPANPGLQRMSSLQRTSHSPRPTSAKQRILFNCPNGRPQTPPAPAAPAPGRRTTSPVTGAPAGTFQEGTADISRHDKDNGSRHGAKADAGCHSKDVLHHDGKHGIKAGQEARLELFRKPANERIGSVWTRGRLAAPRKAQAVRPSTAHASFMSGMSLSLQSCVSARLDADRSAAAVRDSHSASVMSPASPKMRVRSSGPIRKGPDPCVGALLVAPLPGLGSGKKLGSVGRPPSRGAGAALDPWSSPPSPLGGLRLISRPAAFHAY